MPHFWYEFRCSNANTLIPLFLFSNETYVELCHQIASTIVSGDIHLMSIVLFFGVSPLKIPVIIIWDAFHFFFLLMLFSSSMKCDLILFMFGS